MTVVSVISAATSYRPPLSSCRVGNNLHSILDQFKVGFRVVYSLFMGWGGGSHSIHRAKEVGLQNIKGVGHGHTGGQL